MPARRLDLRGRLLVLVATCCAALTLQAAPPTHGARAPGMDMDGDCIPCERQWCGRWIRDGSAQPAALD